jgi:hypothetical protein
MRERTKFVLSLVALGVAASSFREASAGNLCVTIPAPTVQYFSIDMSLGQYFDYTGSVPNAAVLIDDITYAVDLNPCNCDDRCEMFTIDMLAGPGDPIWPVGDPLNIVVPGDHSVMQASADLNFGDFFRDFTITRWAHARGTLFRAELRNTVLGGLGPVFDRVSHTMYGQMIGRQLETDGVATDVGGGNFWSRVGDEEPIVNPIGFTHRSTAYGVGMGVGVTAVNTSESRHYQTPEIMFVGANPPASAIQKIQFASNIAGLTSAQSQYTNAKVSIKGRVILSGAPVRNNDLTVHNMQ